MGDVKLVRDLIPDIAPLLNYRIADRAELPGLLKRKLLEEAGEVSAAATDHERAAELADVLEVAYALAAAQGLPLYQLEKLRRDKANQRGGFSRRLVLLDQFREEDQ
jgi:predicted house-cleaning noncanonical NTP pyrophosphatase (MazG superfamily)